MPFSQHPTVSQSSKRLHGTTPPERAAKRVKRESEEPIDIDAKPHPELSFHDGNVILIAEKTSFRLHRSQLERRSPVLKDMLSSEFVEMDEDEKCVVLRLSHTAHDLGIFLDALYNGLRYRETDTQPTWVLIRPLLRLATHYQVESLRLEAIHQLNRAFPQEIEAWEKIYAPHVPYPRPESGVMHWNCSVDCIGIANLAKEMDLPHVRFAALYFCCRLPSERLVLGIPQRDGSRDCLSPDDLVRCLKACKRFAVVSQTFMLVLVTEVIPSAACRARGSPCKLALDTTYGRINTTPMYSPLTVSPLTEEQQDGLCKDCLAKVDCQRRDSHEFILRHLSSYFA